ALALGARPDDTETVPYGVDATRFAPSADARGAIRQSLGIGGRPFVFTAGRLVRTKGFDVLIDTAARLRHERPDLVVAIAGEGDLAAELRTQAHGAGDVRLLGNRSQDEIARLCAAADIVAVPSV